MRFETLRLERYGPFTDRTVTFRPGARLHVVHGANEAGKTSMLSAVGDLLFGFGKRTEHDFLHEGKMLRIGASLRLDDGSSLSFRRRKGDKNTILDESGQPLRDDLLAPLLGTVTRDMFRAEFGLTADALRKGGHDLLKAGGRLAETLAAASAGVSALSRAGARLQAEADLLFGPRRVASKPFYVACDQYQDAQRRFRDAIITADALRDADRAVKDAGKQCESLGVDHDAVGRGLALRRRALRTRAKLLRIDELRAELKTFGDLPSVGAETSGLWRAAQRDMIEITARSADLDFADSRAAAAIAALAVDETLLTEEANAEALRERLGAVRKAEEDLPKRREAQRAAREGLEDASARLGLPSHVDLLARLPSDPALARVRELGAATRRSGERVDEAERQLRDADAELERFASEEASGAAIIDPEPLRRRLELFAETPADADSLRRLTAACDAAARALEEDAATLDPRAGSLDEIARLPLPDEAAIEAARREAETLASKAARLDADIDAGERKLALIETDVARRSAFGAIMTRADLAAARARRDDALDALDDALDAGAADRRARLDALAAAIAEADRSADQLLSGAEAATLLETARNQLADARAALECMSRERDVIEQQSRSTRSLWEQLWEPCGVAPKSPAPMLKWRERAADLLARRRRLEDQRIEREALAGKLEASRPGLLQLLADLHADPDPRLPAEMLFREARGRIDRLHAAWTGHREQEVARRKAAEDMRKAQAALIERREALDRERAAWPAAAAAIGLSADASPAEAEAALAVWQGAPMLKAAFEDATHRVESIERDLSEFKAEVTALAAKVAPDLAAAPPRAALEDLTRRIAKARAASQERESLQKAAAERSDQRAAFDDRRRQLAKALGEARRALALDDDGDLAAALSRLEQRGILQSGLDSSLRDLAESADGQDEATLRGEQAGIDFDALASEIERMEMLHKQLIADIAEAATRLHDAKKFSAALMEGRDAEGAAREKTEAGAALVEIAERWLVRAAAAKLASRAIERHRASVEEPLIGRASALFGAATASSFKGLATDYNDEDQPVLVGVRADLRQVPVAGMSEGARDQLFLALRLALLEQRAAEPLPFIGDDLLASFDEDRVGAAVEILADFGRSRQAILFTHHSHVAEIARKRLGPDADVIAL